jgi:hypothetical protein
MLRFDRLIRASMTVGEVKLAFPQTVSVFENYGFRDVCDDCSIDLVARRQGLLPYDVVNELNWLLLGSQLHTK